MARIFISTGEVSGDLQGAMLVAALQRQASPQLNLEIAALGGDRMGEAGAKLLGNTATIGSVGILESLPFVLPTYRIQQRAKQHLLATPPDLLILIDYLGPNLAIGSFARQHLPDIPIIYYIAPQDWVWSPFPQNTRRLIALTDRLLAIFPEEARYFRDRGADVIWVGHPMVDRMQHAPQREASREQLGIPPEQIAIALLPASRQQEIRYLLPVICEAARRLQAQLPHVHFWIPISLPGYREAIADAVAACQLNATLLDGRVLEAIAASDLAIAKSGTVNLEIAFLDVPQVVLYRVNPVTMWLGRKLLNFSIPFMSPANLVLGQEIVPELLQEAATPENIVREALALLTDSQRRSQIRAGYRRVREGLGEVGTCDRAAREILQMLCDRSRLK